MKLLSLVGTNFLTRWGKSSWTFYKYKMFNLLFFFQFKLRLFEGHSKSIPVYISEFSNESF